LPSSVFTDFHRQPIAHAIVWCVGRRRGAIAADRCRVGERCPRGQQRRVKPLIGQMSDELDEPIAPYDDMPAVSRED